MVLPGDINTETIHSLRDFLETNYGLDLQSVLFGDLLLYADYLRSTSSDAGNHIALIIVLKTASIYVSNE